MPSMRMINEFMGKRTMKQLREERDILELKNAELLAALKEIKELTKYWNNNLPHRMELINGICDQKIAEAEEVNDGQ